jgi:hypothetical protein
MNQEAIRQLLHLDGREMGSGKKKGVYFSPHKILAPPYMHNTHTRYTFFFFFFFYFYYDDDGGEKIK